MGFFLGVARVLFVSLLASAVAAGGSCENPKVRREWRTLTPDERGDWIRAVNCLTALPHDPRLAPTIPLNVSLIPPVNETSSFYDDIVYVHMDLNIQIHYTGWFFPWHRYYVQFFENMLVEKCGFKGASPYWDWTQDAPDFYDNSMFDNSSYGVGAWGDPANDFQIFTGGFKDMVMAYPTPHHIRRNLTLFPFAMPHFFNRFAGDPNAPPPPVDLMINTTMTKAKVDFLVSNYEGDFFGFQSDFESGAHAGPHLIINGEMSGACPHDAIPPACYPGPRWSPNDPLFFMHHAMVDKVWYDWQNKSPRNKYAYGGGSVSALPSYQNFSVFTTGFPPYLNFDSQIPGDGFWTNITVWDIFDTTGDTLCYTYA